MFFSLCKQFCRDKTVGVWRFRIWKLARKSHIRGCWLQYTQDLASMHCSSQRQIGYSSHKYPCIRILKRKLQWLIHHSLSAFIKPWICSEVQCSKGQMAGHPTKMKSPSILNLSKNPILQLILLVLKGQFCDAFY